MKRYSRVLTTCLMITFALTATAETGKRHQYLVALSRSIDKSSLTRLGATIDSDLNDTLLITVDEDNVDLLRSLPGVRYLQRVIVAGERGDGVRPRSTAAVKSLTSQQHPPSTYSLNWTSGDYSYDAAGNITAIGTSNVYWYDRSNRLVHAATAGHTQDIAYDGFGNMTSMTTDAQPHQMATTASTNHLDVNQYDVAGNVKADDFGYHYIYDAFNMIQDKRQGLEIDLYDAADERIGALRGGKWTWTLRDESGKVLREYQSSDATPSAPALWLGDYVWRDGSLAGAQRVAEEGGARHFHNDHLGNARLVTGAGGLQIARHDFYPFGREITVMNQDTVAGMREDTFRFTGHERDWSSGTLSDNTDYLDYMHARYYNPNGGRFLSTDPMLGNPHEPQSWNAFAYVNNNPMTLLDPFGLEPFDSGASGSYNRPVDGVDCGGNAPCGIIVTAPRPHWTQTELSRRANAAIGREEREFLSTALSLWNRATSTLTSLSPMHVLGSPGGAEGPPQYMSVTVGLTGPLFVGGVAQLNVDKYGDIYIGGGPAIGTPGPTASVTWGRLDGRKATKTDVRNLLGKWSNSVSGGSIFGSARTWSGPVRASEFGVTLPGAGYSRVYSWGPYGRSHD